MCLESSRVPIKHQTNYTNYSKYKRLIQETQILRIIVVYSFFGYLLVLQIDNSRRLVFRIRWDRNKYIKYIFYNKNVAKIRYQFRKLKFCAPLQFIYFLRNLVESIINISEENIKCENLSICLKNAGKVRDRLRLQFVYFSTYARSMIKMKRAFTPKMERPVMGKFANGTGLILPREKLL